MAVNILVPAALAQYTGGRRDVSLAVGPTTVAELFDRLVIEQPALERRIRDERGAIRRHVNVYVDGDDIRSRSGVETSVPDGASVSILAAISGG